MQESIQQFSPRVRELANDYKLGMPLAEYRWGITRLSLIGIFVGAAFFGLWMVAFVRNFPLAVQDTPFFASITLLWLVLILYRFYRLYYWRLYTCSKGFLILKRNQVDIFRWEEVETFWRRVIHIGALPGIPLQGLLFLLLLDPVLCRYKIERSDGYSVVLTHSIRRAEQLGATFERYIADAMLPRLLALYNEGEQVDFGPLSISQAGISKGGRLLSWDEIQTVKLAQNFMGADYNIVEIRKEGRGAWTVPVPTVPDVSVFVALARHVLQQKGGK